MVHFAPLLTAACLLTGRVTDTLTDQPLAGVHLELRQRTLLRTDDGSYQLPPLTQTSWLASTVTDAHGAFTCVIPALGPESWPLLSARHPDYLEQVQTLAPPRPGAPLVAHFALLPELWTPASAQTWSTRQALRRATLYHAHPEFDQSQPDTQSLSHDFTGAPKPAPAAPSAAGSTSTGPVVFPVPDQVYVTNLAGTGFSGWMDLDELIAGTVTAEMNDGFPFEALKAQAVAARTFALDRLRRRGYANGGQAYTPTLGAKSRTATLNTHRLVLLYQGQPITAYFSARCNGDATLNSEEGPTLSNCRVGGLGVGVVSWARSRPCSGHAHCGATTEPCCEIMVRGTTQHIYGHGVGLCQRGAQDFAGQSGWSGRQILTHYYTGIVIANEPDLGPGQTVVARTSVNVRDTPCGSQVLTRLDAGALALVVAGPERPVCALASPYRFYTWWQLETRGGVRGWAAEDFLLKNWESPSAPMRLDWNLNVTGLTLTWPAGQINGQVQVAPSLRPPVTWSAVTHQPGFDGAQFHVTLPPSIHPAFYRWTHP